MPSTSDLPEAKKLLQGVVEYTTTALQQLNTKYNVVYSASQFEVYPYHDHASTQITISEYMFFAS